MNQSAEVCCDNDDHNSYFNSIQTADHKLCLRYKKHLAFHAVLDKIMKTEIGSYVEASCLFVNTAVMTLTKWLAVLLIKLTIALLKHIVSVCVKNLSRV